MQFSCDTHALADAVGVVQRAVSSKSSLPALEGILLRADGSTVSLSAYDLEVGMFASIEGQIRESGDIVLNAKLFSDMVRKLPADRVDIRTDEKLMTSVTSGAAEFTILGIPAGEFPELPALTDGTRLQLPENLLSSMIRQTSFAISDDDSKPVHTGSLFEVTADTLRVVSVDGFRLAIRTEKIKDGADLHFVVPGKTLNEIFKMLSPDSDELITLSVGQKHALFEIHGYSVISRLLEGEFLDYRSVLGGPCDTEVKVSVRDFLGSVDRASLLISDRLKSPVRCVFGPESIKVRCTTSIGRAFDEIPAALKGHSFEMGFNNRYLLDALKATDCDEVRLCLNGPLSPMKIYPPEGDSFIFLVLPVRLKADE